VITRGIQGKGDAFFQHAPLGKPFLPVQQLHAALQHVAADRPVM
jgi:hypothetical protein